MRQSTNLARGPWRAAIDQKHWAALGLDSASNPDADELLKIEAESDKRETGDESEPDLSGLGKMRRFLRSCREKMDDDAFYAMIDALAGEDDDLAGDDLPSRKANNLPENALAAMDAALGLTYVRNLAGSRLITERRAASPSRSPTAKAYEAAVTIAPGVTRITVGG